MPSFGAAKGCFLRLEEYLEGAERSDQRLDNSGRKFTPESETIGETVIPSHSSISEKGDSVARFGLDADSAIAIQSADLGFSDIAQLKSINLEIKKGEHIVITGAVGCGKSLLLKAILGEVEPLSGTMRVNTNKIGYCSQVPWLENLSVRENLRRFLPEDSDFVWQRTLIQGFVLEGLVKNDDSIGSAGVKLSGGERQRLVNFHFFRQPLKRPHSCTDASTKLGTCTYCSFPAIHNSSR